MLKPLRARGTEDQRIRRIKKWTRRGRINMLRNHFPGVWRCYLKGVAFDKMCLEMGILSAEEVAQSRFAGRG